MLFCAAAMGAGVAALCIALFQYHNYWQVIFTALLMIPAYPTLIKWFKDAFQREHGNKDKKQ